jgi:DNA-binding transcriptional LysR family regulator
MDYNDIPLFVRVVEARSFTAAAEALGREKSSVSRAVARLESDLGVRLLQRTTRKLALTDAGQAFYERVRASVTGVDEAASAVRELGGEPRGTVRMTAPADSYTFGIPEVLAEFVQRYPAIDIDLTLSSRQVDLVGEGFDIALRGGRLVDSTLVARRIGSTDLALFASPEYLKRKGTPQKFEDLANHDLVLYRARDGRNTLTLTGPEGPVTMEVRPKITADDMAFLARAAIAGAGIALVAAMFAGDPAERKELQLVLQGYRVEGGTLQVVLPSSAFVPSRVALLRDFLVERLTPLFKTAEQRCSEARALTSPTKKPIAQDSATAPARRRGRRAKDAARRA